MADVNRFNQLGPERPFANAVGEPDVEAAKANLLDLGMPEDEVDGLDWLGWLAQFKEPTEE